MVYVLDTDHVSLLENGHAGCMERLESFEADQLAITAVTVEERMQGWLSAIRRSSAPSQTDRLVWAYVGLRQTVRYVNEFRILDWSEAAARQFADWRREGVRIGTQDLRIAAIAMTIDAVVVTRNQKDFLQVPGLRIEDWTV